MVPLNRPMYIDYGSDERAYENEQEFLFGDILLAAPIASPGEGADKTASQKVWFPSGDVWYDEVNFSKLGFRERKSIRKDIGMIFQGGALLDSSTVVENVKLPLDLFTSQSEREKMERVNFCLQRVRLDGANELYPAELSGGMIKRVAIARAIVMNPRYLFCDEPNSGLDPQTSIVIDNLIHEITQEYGITTIINTHDMNSVMEIGEKIVYIHEGRKWWEGTKDDILHADNPELNDFVFASAMAKKAKLAAK